MEYRLIIQDLKESPDPNVRAFVREVEKMKRLTCEERRRYLKNRHMPEYIRILVNDYIPYIIRVAYGHREETRKLSVLDLINEGIIGAYAAFDKYNYQGKNMIVTLRSYIKRYIRNLLEKNGCMIDDDFYSHEEDLVKDFIEADVVRVFYWTKF